MLDFIIAKAILHFDFLLKPYMPDELYKVMERIRTDFSTGRIARQNLSELTMRMPASSSIAAESSSG